MSTNLEFQKTIWGYYEAYGRDLPWRHPEVDGSFDAYKILVSEFMLQQTQVSRVIPKYEEFLHLFPTIQTLADASLGDVIKAWSGLGYNRRAKYLWQSANQLITKAWPCKLEDLVDCPGIGLNTAGAVLAYAYNQPVVFIETNIRTVFIHHFFAHERLVSDKDILELVAETLDKKNSREWYWALMDYGSYLKASIGNVGRLSKTHTKQSKFEGSNRQIRGQVIRLLINGGQQKSALEALISDTRLGSVLDSLCQEGLIIRTGLTYKLK